MNTHIKYPTIEELELYHNGRLDDARCHEIERLSLEDPLVADALDGFHASPHFHAIPAITQILPNAAAATTKVGIIAKTWTILNAKIGIGLLASATLITTSVLLYNSDSNSSKQEIQTNAVIPSKPDSTNKTPDALPIDLKDQHAITSTLPQSQETRSIQPDENIPNTSENTIIIEASDSQGEFLEDEVYTYLWVEMKDVKGHHVLDYSDVYNKDYPHPDRILAGEKTNSSDTLSYLDFLEILLVAFDDKKYSDTEKLCAWMNKKQSADINATFYGAISAFYLGKYDDAKNGFKKITSGTAMAHRRDSKKFLAKIHAIETNSKEK